MKRTLHILIHKYNPQTNRWDRSYANYALDCRNGKFRYLKDNYKAATHIIEVFRDKNGEIKTTEAYDINTSYLYIDAQTVAVFKVRFSKNKKPNFCHQNMSNQPC